MKALVFDLDGTIANTAGELTDALNDTFEQLSYPLVSESQVQKWIGGGAKELFTTALARVSGVSKANVATDAQFPRHLELFVASYSQRCATRAGLYLGAKELLHALPSLGIPCALLTNKESCYVQPLLAFLGIEHCFDLVLCGDTVTHRKPHPVGLVTCAQHFKISACEEMVFVGDSWIDVATARAAGIAMWACSYGYNRGQPIENEAPDRVITHLGEIHAALLGIPEIVPNNAEAPRFVTNHR